MKKSLLLTLAVGALALAGCSSTATRVDHGPIQASTFSFFDHKARSAPAFADGATQVHARVQEAIGKHLAAKGISQVAAGGDIVVGYLVILSDNASTEVIDDYFGYGEDRAKLQEKAHGAFAVDHKNTTPYPAGTLLIDVMDSKTWKLLKRSYAWRPVMSDLPPEQRAARLQDAVDEALKGLKVAK